MEQALCLEEGAEWLEEDCVEEDLEERDGMKTREDVRIQDRVGGLSFDGASSRPSRSLPGHATELHLDDEAGNHLGVRGGRLKGWRRMARRSGGDMDGMDAWKGGI